MNARQEEVWAVFDAEGRRMTDPDLDRNRAERDHFKGFHVRRGTVTWEEPFEPRYALRWGLPSYFRPDFTSTDRSVIEAGCKFFNARDGASSLTCRVVVQRVKDGPWLPFPDHTE